MSITLNAEKLCGVKTVVVLLFRVVENNFSDGHKFSSSSDTTPLSSVILRYTTAATLNV